MQYLKHALLLAGFALFSFSLEAAAPLHSFSSVQTTVNAPQTEGVVLILQGRNAVRVEILVDSPVRLVVTDDAGVVVYRRRVRPQVRNVGINTNALEAGTYMLQAISDIGTQEVNFSIGDEEE